MNTQVVVLAAVAVLLHVSAGRGLSVRSQNNGYQLDAGDGTGMEQVSDESDVSNRDLDAGNLMLVRESVGNELHDIRRREARSEKRSRKRQGESGDESGMDQKQEPDEKVTMKGISDFLEPQKEMIINFMKPILDRIKHTPKKPSLGNSSESSASPASPTPLPSSDSDASISSDSDASNSTNSDASNSTTSDASNPTTSDASNSTTSNASTSSDSDTSNSTTPNASNSTNFDADVYPPFPFSSSKCGDSERHRSMSTLSLLFPDLQSNKGEQPFVFVPLTNTLMRVVEQKIMKESQSGEEPRRKLHN